MTMTQDTIPEPEVLTGQPPEGCGRSEGVSRDSLPDRSQGAAVLRGTPREGGIAARTLLGIEGTPSLADAERLAEWVNVWVLRVDDVLGVSFTPFPAPPFRNARCAVIRIPQGLDDAATGAALVAAIGAHLCCSFADGMEFAAGFFQGPMAEVPFVKLDREAKVGYAPISSPVARDHGDGYFEIVLPEAREGLDNLWDLATCLNRLDATPGEADAAIRAWRYASTMRQVQAAFTATAEMVAARDHERHGPTFREGPSGATCWAREELAQRVGAAFAEGLLCWPLAEMDNAREYGLEMRRALDVEGPATLADAERLAERLNVLVRRAEIPLSYIVVAQGKPWAAVAVVPASFTIEAQARFLASLLGNFALTTIEDPGTPGWEAGIERAELIGQAFSRAFLQWPDPESQANSATQPACLQLETVKAAA